MYHTLYPCYTELGYGYFISLYNTIYRLIDVRIWRLESIPALKGLTLVRRRRRWTNVKAKLGECLAYAGLLVLVNHKSRNHTKIVGNSVDDVPRSAQHATMCFYMTVSIAEVHQVYADIHQTPTRKTPGILLTKPNITTWNNIVKMLQYLCVS